MMNLKSFFLLFFLFVLLENIIADSVQHSVLPPFCEANRTISFVETEIDTNELKIEIITFKAFKKRMQSSKDNKLYIYNFWATWCKPCVEELPFFEQLAATYPDEIEVILVSVDNPATAQEKLPPFIDKMQIKSEVIVVQNFGDQAIATISNNWDGEIPATLFVNRQKGINDFYAKSFTLNELKVIVEQHCKQSE